MLRSVYLALAVPATGALSGCYLGDRLTERMGAVVAQSGNEIVFYLPSRVDMENVVAIELGDLVVNKRESGSEGRLIETTVWRVTRIPSPSWSYPSIKWPIKYGSHIDGMRHEIGPVALSPGNYFFEADIYVRRSGETSAQAKALVIVREFTVNAEMRLE